MSQDRSVFIDDGYTVRAYIAPVEGLHGELRFSYRPVLVRERTKLETHDAKGVEFDKVAADLVASKVTSWNVKDSKGDAVGHTAANLLRLDPNVFLKLFKMVMGWLPTDLDPQWAEEDREKAQAEAEEAQRLDIDPGQLRDEGDSKN